MIGESTTLYCEARGVHRPSVAWFINGHPVLTDSRITLSTEGVDNDTIVSKLSFNYTVRSDSAVYICNASNSAGSDAASIALSILGEKATFSFPSLNLHCV